MDSSALREVMKEYEIKQNKASNELEKREKQIISTIPEYENLKQEIAKLSIEALKNNLNQNKEARIKEQNILKQRLDTINTQIEQLLLKYHFSKDYLNKQYECSICLDTGYVGQKKCSCLRQRMLKEVYDSANLNRLEEENFSTFDLGYYSAKTSDQNAKSPLENIQLIKEKAIKFCDNIHNKQEKNLLFIGNTGLGKTFLSNCIAERLLKQGCSVIYETASDLMDKAIRYKMNFQGRANEYYQEMLECDLLILDDLGTESINNMKFTELFTILNTRLLKDKKMLISTNYSLENLYKLYDERVISRLIGNFHIMKFYGEDIRLKKKKMNY